MYEHLNPLREKLLFLSIDETPDPWKLVATFSVGGLRSVGFDRDSENLLMRLIQQSSAEAGVQSTASKEG